MMPGQERHQSMGKRESKMMPGQKGQHRRRNAEANQLPQARTGRRLRRRCNSKRTAASRGTHGEITEYEKRSSKMKRTTHRPQTPAPSSPQRY